MDTLIIVMIIAIISVLLYAISGFIAFLYAFMKRKPKAQKIKKKRAWAVKLDKLPHPRKDEFDAAYLKGKEWVTSTPYKEMQITSYDGLKLNGYFFDGKDTDHKKICILFHGYRSNVFHDFCGAAIDYNNNGTDMLLVDQRAHGKSEGKFITMGVKESRDCLEWCKHVSMLYPDADITLCGISMGATTVLMASALDLPKNVKAVIADCGFTCPYDIVKKVAADMKLPFGFIYPSMNLAAKIFGGFSLKETSTVKSMDSNNLPILFIHGTGDDFVPYQMTVECYDRCKAAKKLMLIEGADHGYSYLYEYERMYKQEMDWLNGIYS